MGFLCISLTPITTSHRWLWCFWKRAIHISLPLVIFRSIRKWTNSKSSFYFICEQIRYARIEFIYTIIYLRSIYFTYSNIYIPHPPLFCGHTIFSFYIHHLVCWFFFFFSLFASTILHFLCWCSLRRRYEYEHCVKIVLTCC